MPGTNVPSASSEGGRTIAPAIALRARPPVVWAELRTRGRRLRQALHAIGEMAHGELHRRRNPRLNERLNGKRGRQYDGKRAPKEHVWIDRRIQRVEHHE